MIVWFLGLVEVLGWKSNEWVANPDLLIRSTFICNTRFILDNFFADPFCYMQ